MEHDPLGRCLPVSKSVLLDLALPVAVCHRVEPSITNFLLVPSFFPSRHGRFSSVCYQVQPNCQAVAPAQSVVLVLDSPFQNLGCFVLDQAITPYKLYDESDSSDSSSWFCPEMKCMKPLNKIQQVPNVGAHVSGNSA